MTTRVPLDFAGAVLAHKSDSKKQSKNRDVTGAMFPAPDRLAIELCQSAFTGK
jgi:hypothetical protein